MDGIGAFLRKYLNFTPPARAVQQAVVAAVFEVLGVSVPDSAVRVQGEVAHIAQGGALKSEILLRKSEILSAARAKAGEGLRDIR